MPLSAFTAASGAKKGHALDYNALLDPQLAGYLRRPRMFKELKDKGLISAEGAQLLLPSPAAAPPTCTDAG